MVGPRILVKGACLAVFPRPEAEAVSLREEWAVAVFQAVVLGALPVPLAVGDQPRAPAARDCRAALVRAARPTQAEWVRAETAKARVEERQAAPRAGPAAEPRGLAGLAKALRSPSRKAAPRQGPRRSDHAGVPSCVSGWHPQSFARSEHFA